jgi:hypothetical protein
MPQGFFSVFKTAAESPFGVLVFLSLLVAWAWVTVAQYRLKRISKIILAVPEQNRAALLAREYSTFPRTGLSAEQWIRSRQNQYRFYAVLAVIAALTLIVVTVLSSPKQPKRISGPAHTAGPQSPSITGDGNQVTIGQPNSPSEQKPPDKSRKP